MNLLGIFGNSRGVYRTPDGKQAAYYASFIQRFAATITDWLVSGWVPFFFVGLFSSFVWGGGTGTVAGNLTLAGFFWLIIVTICVLGYLTIFGGNGRTLGMRIVGIRVVDPSTGEPPGYQRAFIRAILTFIFGVALFVLINDMLSNDGKQGSAVIVIAVAVVIVGIWAHAFMLFDLRGQTVQDRICGVLYIQKPVDLPEDMAGYVERLQQRRQEAQEAEARPRKIKRRRVWIGDLKRAEAERAERAERAAAAAEANGLLGPVAEEPVSPASRPRQSLPHDTSNPRAPGKSRGRRRSSQARQSR
ncbi:MAG TPA: RDD family protein [Thermomicrobiaceae bacterium]|nr:RDD family protein [Thermomicrobiaceae bacterium]